MKLWHEICNLKIMVPCSYRTVGGGVFIVLSPPKWRIMCHGGRWAPLTHSLMPVIALYCRLIYEQVCDSWPVRCQTYGYLPSIEASLHFHYVKLYWLMTESSMLAACPKPCFTVQLVRLILETCLSRVQLCYWVAQVLWLLSSFCV